MPNYDFLVVGSSTVDVFAKTKDIERIDISGRKGESAEHFVCISFGSKTDLENLSMFPGGSASNSAVAMQALGSKAKLLTCIGNDPFGDIVMRDLQKHNVDTTNVVIKKSLNTGVGLNITAPSGEKSMLIYRGANDALGPEHLKDNMVKDADKIFITSLVSKRNFTLFIKLIKLAKKYRKPIVFAPSISMLHKWLKELRKLHTHFDVFILNYEEGCFYTDKEEMHDILKHLPGDVDIVSKDVEGAYAKEGSKYFHSKTLKTKIVDSCGAGDSFSGAFAHYYYNGRKHSASEALSKAVGIANIKLTQCGARLSTSPNKAASFIKKNRTKLKARRL
jgi:sugar/nucleoside kinase (ribokinase family)